MMGSGFKLVDALGAAVDSVNNAVMRQAIGELKVAVSRGEKLSSQLEKYDDLFPAVISQLVIIGEQTGNLAKSTKSVTKHLGQQVERKIERVVAAIEPMMTMGLVFCVGGIMLAIYEPMFAMLQTIE
jgi:type IV pilus assembly protein PilC